MEENYFIVTILKIYTHLNMDCPVNHCVSDDCSSDNYGCHESENFRNVVSELYYKLENLNFTQPYESNSNTVAVNIMNFHPWKFSISINESKEGSWNVWYDNKILILKLKAFSGEICRSKVLPRQKYIRIEDLCLKKIYRKICHLISHLINAKEYRDWSKEYSKVFLNYFDHKLSLQKTHYFEDVSIVFEGAELIKGEGKHPKLRLKNEMIKAKSMSV